MATEDYSPFNKPLAFAGATNIDESAVPPLLSTEQEEPSPTRFPQGDHEQGKGTSSSCCHFWIAASG